MALSVLSNPAKAAENTITGLRIGEVQIDGGPALRVVIETRRPTAAKLTLLSDPFRFVVDIPGAEWGVDSIQPKGTLTRAPAKAYRYGKPDPLTGRVVIEMDAPAAPVRRFALPATATRGHRLVFDLADHGKAAFSLAATTLSREGLRDYAAGTPSKAQSAPAPTVQPAPKP
ncbi:MAG: AMIN domain-containing protein, partial [Pseudomonadota bacterium]|nr:AMIN domain-containing protein [Pseudomonadota bacterium]